MINILIPLTLGFVGSLHCAGMCAPMCMGVCGRSSRSAEWSVVYYNIGRVLTYALLGLVFGQLGTLFFMAGVQRFVAVLSGIVIIGIVLKHSNLDLYLSKTWVGAYLFTLYHSLSTKLFKGRIAVHPFFGGVLNGILPCSLLFVALAGAVSTGNTLNSMIFMLVFGMATWPSMIIASLFGLKANQLSPKLSSAIIPLASLVFGSYLIYRGFYNEIPEQISLWASLNNELMCK